MSCRNSILIPFIIILASLTLGEPNCVYKPRGGSVTLKLKYEGLKKDDQLIWKKNGLTIFNRNGGIIIKGKESDITPEGFLQLQDLKASDNGEYQGEEFDRNGKSHKNDAKQICVIEPVTKPTVDLICTKATLICKVEPNPTNPTFSWLENNITMPGKTTSTIEFNPKQRKGSKYSCSVENQVSKETSNETEINCEDEVTGTGFGLWMEILMSASSGTLLVILVVVVVVCIYRRRQHKQKQHRDEEEFQLTDLTHGQQPHPPGHHSHQAPLQKTHAGQCGHPHSDDHPLALPKPRHQSLPGPRHPQGPANGQEHLPPSPKTRKALPHLQFSNAQNVVGDCHYQPLHFTTSDSIYSHLEHA